MPETESTPHTSHPFCRIGWHWWARVTFGRAPGWKGRYCVRCEKMQIETRLFLPRWDTVDRADRAMYQPNKDGHGYY